MSFLILKAPKFFKNGPNPKIWNFLSMAADTLYIALVAEESNSNVEQSEDKCQTFLLQVI